MPAATASPCSHSGVAGGRLDGVAEGVPQVQQRAIAGFALVAAHDFGLELAGAMDGMRPALPAPAPAALRTLRSIHSRNFGSNNQAVLDHLGQARAQLARRQGAQRGRVGEHGAGLVEGADQVLAAG